MEGRIRMSWNQGNIVETSKITVDVEWYCERCGKVNRSNFTISGCSPYATVYCDNPICGKEESSFTIDIAFSGSYKGLADLPLLEKEN
jgi:late competence protein required for DNA uptake (superfamily II DNA/RNA helicase)